MCGSESLIVSPANPNMLFYCENSQLTQKYYFTLKLRHLDIFNMGYSADPILLSDIGKCRYSCYRQISESANRRTEFADLTIFIPVFYILFEVHLLRFYSVILWFQNRKNVPFYLHVSTVNIKFAKTPVKFTLVVIQSSIICGISQLINIELLPLRRKVKAFHSATRRRLILPLANTQIIGVQLCICRCEWRNNERREENKVYDDCNIAPASVGESEECRRLITYDYV